MKIKSTYRFITVLVSFTVFVLCISNVPVEASTTDTMTLTLKYLCTEGSHTITSIKGGQSGTESLGSYISNAKLCPHGHNAEHWYDTATGISSVKGYAEQYTDSNKPAPQVREVSRETSAPTVTLYKVAADLNQTGQLLSIDYSGSYVYNDYVLPNGKIKLTFSSPTHMPILFNGISYDGYSSSTTVLGFNLYGSSASYITLGQVNGTVQLEADTTGYSYHEADVCPINVQYTGSHSMDTGAASTTLYYDQNHIVIGQKTNITYSCKNCGYSYSNTTGSLDNDYTGNVYDSNGNIVGYVDPSGFSSDQIGIDFSYLQEGYSYSSQPQVFSNGCVTASVYPCTDHHYIGSHYYCSTHGYIGTNKYCYYSSSGALIYNAPEYGYSGPASEIFVSKNTLVVDSTCDAYVNYLSTYPGKQIICTVTRFPSTYKYSVTGDSGTVYASGYSSTSTFSYEMPSEPVTVSIERGKLQQEVNVVTTKNLVYNSAKINLNASVKEG